MRRVLSGLFITTLVLVATAVPAAAACHVAGFVETSAVGSPDTGVVSLVVELQGRVGSCAGTVDVATVDGTAVAGQDYEAVTQTLTFEENDDRVETVDVTILPEARRGGSFTVELSNPTGDISGTGGAATVSISGEPDVVVPEEDEGGGMLGIGLAVLAALLIGAGAFQLLRGRG